MQICPSQNAARTASPPWPYTTCMDVGLERARAANNVPQQRPAGERLQDLGEIGFHSLALTGSEDDDGEFHEAASLAGWRAHG